MDPLVPLVVAGFAVVYVVVMRPSRRALYKDTGLVEWRETARRLPWADRWTISRAVNRGVAVESRLAPLAVQRARVSLALLDVYRRRRTLWWFAGRQVATIAMLMVASILARAWALWVLTAAMAAVAGVATALLAWQIPRARRRLQRTIELNRLSPSALPDLRSLPHDHR